MNSKKGNWATLGDITTLCNYGYTAKADDNSRGIMFLRITDIREDGALKEKGFKFVPYNKEVLDKYKLKEGDIVIARSGSVGRSYLYNQKDGEMIFASYLIRFSIDKTIANPKYIHYILHSSLFYDFVNSTKRKVAQTNINALELKGFKLPLPSLEVQAKIVYLADRSENLRALREMANDNPDLIAKTIFFKMFGDPASNTKGFTKKKLSDVSIISMGGTPSTKEQKYWDGGTLNWMKSGDIKQDFIMSIPQKITDQGLKNSSAKVYKKGDVVIALNGQGKTRGTTGIIELSTSSNQSVASISPYPELNNIYLNFNLKYRYKELRDLTGDDQRSGLNLTLLRNLNISIPPIDLQNEFAFILTKIRSLKDNQMKSTHKINELHNSILESAIHMKLKY